MAGKHDTKEPSRRHLGSKLSSLIVRHGSSKNKKPADAVEDSGSVFGFKRQKKAPTMDNTALQFKPLEVDLNTLESMHLSDGWLEKEKPRSDPKNDDQENQPPNVDNSATPIADAFSVRSSMETSRSALLDRSSSQTRSINGRRPFSMAAPSITYVRNSGDFSVASDNQDTGSVLNRGRPVESRRYVTDPLWKSKETRSDMPPPSIIGSAERVVISKDLTPKPVQFGRSSPPSVKQTASQLLATEGSGRTNRHSMFAAVTQPQENGVARTRPPSAPRSSSAAPTDRIQAWQKSITSAPKLTPSFVPPSFTGSSFTPPVPSQSGAPVRRLSTRGGAAGNRLAWIKELEEKKSNSVNGDIGVLKKQMGSVSNKLAMFESKQGSAAPPVSRLVPVTRSSSTTSRLSSVAVDSASSVNGNATATPRTSTDTTRSSHRTSSVMNYYDDSFREKMESMVSGYTADKDKKEADKKQRVTAQFIPVDTKKSEAMPSKVPSEVATSAIGTEKEAEDSKSPQAETAASASETVKEADDLESAPVAVAAPIEDDSAPVEEEAENAESNVAAVSVAPTEKVEAEPQPTEPLAATEEVEKAAQPESVSAVETQPEHIDENSQSSGPDPADDSAIDLDHAAKDVEPVETVEPVQPVESVTSEVYAEENESVPVQAKEAVASAGQSEETETIQRSEPEAALAVSAEEPKEDAELVEPVATTTVADSEKEAEPQTVEPEAEVPASQPETLAAPATAVTPSITSGKGIHPVEPLQAETLAPATHSVEHEEKTPLLQQEANSEI